MSVKLTQPGRLVAPTGQLSVDRLKRARDLKGGTHCLQCVKILVPDLLPLTPWERHKTHHSVSRQPTGDSVAAGATSRLRPTINDTNKTEIPFYGIVCRQSSSLECLRHASGSIN